MILIVALGGGWSGAGSASTARTASISGRVASLAGDTGGAFGDVEAVSLTNGAIAGSSPVIAGKYSMKVPPGRYLLISRAQGLAGGASLVSTARVTAASKPTTLNLALGLLGGSPSAMAAATSTGVIAIDRIDLSAPPEWRYRPDAAANGAIIGGFIDPCLKAGKMVIDADPSTLESLKGEHRLADAGRSSPLPALNIPTPSQIITGNVTVDQDGRPTADILITDPDGNVIDHVVVAGDPGQFPQSGGGSPGDFLRLVGKGLAERECDKKKPVVTTRPKPTTRPQPVVTTKPGKVASTPGGPNVRVLTILYTGSGSASKAQYNDTYKKDASWEITWKVTISDGQVTDISKPTGTVSGSVTANYPDHPNNGVTSCTGGLGLPGGSEPEIPITLRVMSTTSAFITMQFRQSGNEIGAQGIVPIYWAFSPCSMDATNVMGDWDAATAAKYANQVFQEFTIALANNFQIRPDTFGATYSFGPISFQKSADMRWNSRLTITGSG